LQVVVLSHIGKGIHLTFLIGLNLFAWTTCLMTEPKCSSYWKQDASLGCLLLSNDNLFVLVTASLSVEC